MIARLTNLKGLLGQIEVLKTYYERLTERERTIVIFSAAGGVIFLLFSLFVLVRTYANSLERSITKAHESVSEIEALGKTYSAIETQVNRIEGTIRATSSDFRLATTLERLAAKYQLQIESIKDRPAQPNELYREIQSAVSIKEVNLKTLVNFLHDIESAPELMRIHTLGIRPNFKDPALLNVDFMVSTFQLKD